MATIPPIPAAIAHVFEAAPGRAQTKLRHLRKLIYETAAAVEEVGPLQETLKWGQPAYLTSATRAGTTIRLGFKSTEPDVVRLLVNCQTTLVDGFRDRFGDALTCEGNRAVVFATNAPLPRPIVAQCIEMALTYHVRKRR